MKTPPISLRISNKIMYQKVEDLAQEHNLSLNMTVNMLLGFAFNEIERQNKSFIPKVIFESSQK